MANTDQTICFAQLLFQYLTSISKKHFLCCQFSSIIVACLVFKKFQAHLFALHKDFIIIPLLSVSIFNWLLKHRHCFTLVFSLVWNWEKMAYLQLLRGKAWDFKAFEDLSSTNDSSIFGTFCLVMNTLLSSACLLVYRWKLVAPSLQSAYQNCKTGHWDSRFYLVTWLPYQYRKVLFLCKRDVGQKQTIIMWEDLFSKCSVLWWSRGLTYVNV